MLMVRGEVEKNLKKTLIETKNKDLCTLNLTKHITFYISQWW